MDHAAVTMGDSMRDALNSVVTKTLAGMAVALGVSAMLLSGPSLDGAEKPIYWDAAIDFSANLPIEPNVKGSLTGEIAFIQNTRVMPRRGDKEIPMLVPDRGAYLLFTPSDPKQTALKATVQSKAGKTITLVLNRPEHGARSDFNNKDGRPPVVYNKRAWNGVVPWTFMHPGMSITVTNGTGKKGLLPASGFEFGPPLEFVTQNVEIAMLVDQENVKDNLWSNPENAIAPQLAIDYFQHLPITRFTVGAYLPMTFKKVVLPNGNVYTERSSFTGAGIYKGDMRQDIAKCMVSTGINLANVGITATPGGSEKQPRPFRITTVHTSAGRYTKKGKDGKPESQIVVHGLSGGGGQLTLLNTTGNEYSHEYGHDHGLGHYPGKERGLDRHSRNGAWGYNMFKHRLIANIDWNRGKGTAEMPYAYGTDAMASGRPMGPLSVFTLHTPYALKLIQAKVASQSGILDADSPTGYKKWNQDKQALENWKVETPKPDKFGVPVMTLVGFYDPQHKLTSYIYPALYGNWGNVFTSQTITKANPALAGAAHVLEVQDSAGKVDRFPLADQRLHKKRPEMNQFHVNLDGAKKYVRASLVHLAGGKRQVLDSRTIDPPAGKLPAPVIVGKEAGFAHVALRLQDLSGVLTPNGYPTVKSMERAIGDCYGPITAYAPNRPVEIGKVVKHQGRYYQARSTKPTGTPSPGSEHWRDLGDPKPYLTGKTLALGKQSVDYAKDVMKGKSFVHYYVPVDHEQVVASEVGSGNKRHWYGKAKTTRLTVIGIAADGSKHRIHLQGQINDQHALSHGAPVNSPSRVRFSFHKADNPKLPKGSYAVTFSAYAQGWHIKKLIEAFKVSGKIVVD